MAWADIVAGREPRPHLLGLELEPFPYPSAFSLLMRVTRLMALDSSEWFRCVGLRFGAALPDLFAGALSRSRFEQAIGLATTPVPSWWPEEAWSPLRTSGMLARDRRPMCWCEECASYGFHTTLFQLPMINRCPWHDHALLDRCPNCKAASPALMDSLGQLGRCDCGFDALVVDKATVHMWEFPTAKADAWMSAYLDWASDQRQRRAIVAPERAVQWRVGLAALGAPPAVVCDPRHRGVAIDTRIAAFDDQSTADSPDLSLWGWGALADRHPLTFVPLPRHTHDRLVIATKTVIDRLPPHKGRRLDVTVAPPNQPSAEESEARTDDAERFIAPHGFRADGSVWLDMSAVDLDTLQVCGRLVDEVILACDPMPETSDISRQAARTNALGRVHGGGLLAAALEDILLVGYGQGLDAILRAERKLAPPSGWWLPVVEFEGALGHVDRVRVCWVATPVPRLARKTTAPTPQGSGPRNQRRPKKRVRRPKRATRILAKR